MTTLGNRPATALLVIDVQNAAVAGSYQRDAVVANIGSLVEKARREHVPVIWVQHSDEELERESGDWQIVATSRAEVLRWAVGRIRENPAGISEGQAKDDA
jgi:nicotinamidase-related amidase